MNRIRFFSALITFIILMAPLCATAQNDNARRIKKIQEYVTQAGSLYKKELFEDSGNKIKSAQRLLETAFEVGDESDREILETEYNRIAKAHELLAKQGIELPELMAFPETIGSSADSGDKSDVDDPAEDTGDDAPMDDDAAGSSDGETVSFKTQIVPLLVQHCGNCHVTGTKGRFNMGTYEKLLAGSKGKAMVPGKPEESLLVTLIEDGSMPKFPRGQQAEEFPAADLELIKTWILQGGEFDGDDATAPIAGNQNTPPRRGR